MGPYGRAFAPSALNGVAPQESLWSKPQMVTEAPLSQASCATAWTEVRVWSLLGQRKEESVGWFLFSRGYPQGNAQQGRHRSIS